MVCSLKNNGNFFLTFKKYFIFIGMFHNKLKQIQKEHEIEKKIPKLHRRVSLFDLQ